MFHLSPDASLQAQIHDLAKAEATCLRREAMGDFWRGADAALQRGLGRVAQRSAARLEARLARRSGGQAASSLVTGG